MDANKIRTGETVLRGVRGESWDLSVGMCTTISSFLAMQGDEIAIAGIGTCYSGAVPVLF